jgi:hypothetical protein
MNDLRYALRMFLKEIGNSTELSSDLTGFSIALGVALHNFTNHGLIGDTMIFGFLLEKSTLSSLKASVTLMDGRLKISFSGGGKKSSMGSLAAMARATDLGASLYRVFFFTKAPPFAPESGPEDSNAVSSDAKTHGQHLVVNLAETKITFLFLGAMFSVTPHDSLRVCKG